jgi:hypothetical protein
MHGHPIIDLIMTLHEPWIPKNFPSKLTILGVSVITRNPSQAYRGLWFRMDHTELVIQRSISDVGIFL